ncbi:MAG: hypothetical protein D3914_17050 [Candidatus Electrothrix sp. LOE2]|nr:hypothetical protein [Candidatus Electrothrix sp. LOE2]
MTSRFDNKGDGEQNVGQGNGSIGQQNNYGISPEVFAQYAGDLAVKDAALNSFFRILEEQQVPRSDQDSRLREIAAHYKELLARLATVQSQDPEVVRLKEAAHQVIEIGRFADAEGLLKELKSQISGDTFNNSFNSGGGQQIIAQGTGAIGQQVNYNITQQVSVEELLKLLQEIKGQLPEKAQIKLRNEMKNEKSLP